MVYLFLEVFKSCTETLLCPTARDGFVLSAPSCWQMEREELQTQLMILLNIVQLSQGYILNVKSSKRMDNHFSQIFGQEKWEKSHVD